MNNFRLLITGATGFIGGALAARLIDTPRWDQTLFLVRSENREDGLARIAHVLRKHGVDEDHLDRLHLSQIICGDLTTVAAWGDDARLEGVVDVVSSAAVASFGNHPSIWPTNVDGVMDMARLLHRRCKLRRFLHLGTAMACGSQAPNPVPEGYDGGADTEAFLQYTDSKYEAERRMRTELPDLPLIVARPSIVVGHTHLGCEPSGSIYWVFRLARALKCFPCDLDQKIDVVPVDFCAEALHLLLDKPNLAHDFYHISAGATQASSFRDIDEAAARAAGTSPMGETYQRKPFAEIAAMQGSFRELLGPCNKRIMLRAIRTYGSFSELGLMFDNQRLQDEGMPPPAPFKSYVGLCETSCQGSTIAEQMHFDYK